MQRRRAAALIVCLAACAQDTDEAAPPAASTQVDTSAAARTQTPTPQPSATPITDPFEQPDLASFDPWPVLGRSLRANDLYTAASLTTPDEAMAGKFQPRRERSLYTFSLPVDWDADPYGDKNWRFHFLSLRLVDPLIIGWERTGEQRYLDRVGEIAMDWVRAHPLQDGEATRTWGDMITGLRALRLVWLHDRAMAGDLALPGEEVGLLEASLDQHRIALQNPRFWRQHNHALYAMHGLMAACRVRADAAPEACAQERAYAREGIVRVLRASFADDGGHKEQSPKYHDFVLKTLDRLLEPGWYALSGEDASVMDAAREVSGWMSHADGTYPNIGDSERDRNKAARTAPGPMPGCEGGDPASCTAMRFLPETGYAVLKTASNVAPDERASLFLTCARHARAHKHADSLSFEWMDGGRYLLVDGGKLHYNTDDLRYHLISRAAHNTAAVEGGDDYQAPYTGACLADAALEGGVMTASGSAPIGKDAPHERTLRYEVGEALSVTDTVGGSAPWRLRWNLGADLTATPIPDVPGGYAVTAAGAPVMEARLPGACDWRAVRGGADHPERGGLTSDQYLDLDIITTLEGRCPAGTGPVTSRFTLAG